MKSPERMHCRALRRSAWYGDMKATSVMRPASANRRATSPTRRMFSSRSAGLNPRFCVQMMHMLSFSLGPFDRLSSFPSLLAV